ncbi:MAG TPA: hypothetical protein VGM39_04815 [Kofleriaceae bacterium]|jgi:hypothetical protein
MKLAIVALFSLVASASTALAAPDPQTREVRREQRHERVMERFDHNRDGVLDRNERREAKAVRREHRHEREMRREQRQMRDQRGERQAPPYVNPSQAPGAQ